MQPGGTHWGSLSAPQTLQPQLGRGPTSKGKRGKGRRTKMVAGKGKGRERGEKGGEVEGIVSSLFNFCLEAWC